VVAVDFNIRKQLSGFNHSYKSKPLKKGFYHYFYLAHLRGLSLLSGGFSRQVINKNSPVP